MEWFMTAWVVGELTHYRHPQKIAFLKVFNILKT
jgi:hypothetical protein